MATQSINASVESEKRSPFPETNWDDVHEPGAYVELGSGDLYRMPKEALTIGASPVVIKESHGASRLMKVSNDPFITTLQARLKCAQHNIEPNF